MRVLSRRGFTLIELLVVLTLMGVILGAIYQTIVGSQRATQSQVQQMDVQQQIRAAALYLTNALIELDAAEGDIAVAEPTRMQVRRMHWAAALCTAPAAAGGGVAFTIRDAVLVGLATPDETRDSLLLYRESDPGVRTDDGWLIGGLIATAAQNCPDGQPGRRLTARISAASGGDPAALDGSVTLGAPIRGFQMEEFSLLPDGADRAWLGRRTADRAAVWTGIEQTAGPLTSNGLTFTYYTAAGATPAPIAQIASVSVTVRGRAAAASRLTGGGVGYLVDSVVTRVALRNNPRF